MQPTATNEEGHSSLETILLSAGVHRPTSCTTHEKQTERCPLNLEEQNYVLVSSVPSYNPQTTF